MNLGSSEVLSQKSKDITAEAIGRPTLRKLAFELKQREEGREVTVQYKVN